MTRNAFARRHNGPQTQEITKMLETLRLKSVDELIQQTVPSTIRMNRELDLGPAKEESEALAELRDFAQKNRVYRSYLGMGYYGTRTPTVILRNILENPGWYTQYTPYQAEIAQGRLEALLNFQTMVSDLTGLPVANASLLDEATAAAEAMTLCLASNPAQDEHAFFVDERCHPQTIAVIQTRAKPLNIKVHVGSFEKVDFTKMKCFGALVQYPATGGEIFDYSAFISQAHAAQVKVAMATDLLALALIKSPGELGADIAIGSAQRFGVPMGFGGPHAAFLATRDELKRLIPGRIIGVSQDSDGKPALRLALQTREQHIRREKATSNICTAQALLAIMASMYAVYHGPEGIKEIALSVYRKTRALSKALQKLGYGVPNASVFDTLTIDCGSVGSQTIQKAAEAALINVRVLDSKRISVSLDETVSYSDLEKLLHVFALGKKSPDGLISVDEKDTGELGALKRTSNYLSHAVFNRYHSETEMLRYIHRLEMRDLSLNVAMIPLGSCTMKLNATTEMIPVTWNEFANIHPFAPESQSAGYRELFKQLERMLSEITGFFAVSLQPNAGSQGEYAGLLVIREFYEHKGESNRNVCLIPKSAHGTNPASAAMAGMKVVVIECDTNGNIDLADLEKKARENEKNLAALMVTYPSTHGVFETGIKQICEITHRYGGQVYMDGANMNAQVGLCRPGDMGADVCHLNLHKTFCIPHGGGGPGMGPIGVAQHLAPFLPGHPLVKTGGEKAMGPVSAAPWGSASILPISWSYIRMMGPQGLKEATEIAILSANYVARRLDPYFPVLYKNEKGWVAHECIIDLRKFKETAGIEVEDVAKRLMDYGFHAPTISWPVPGTMMIEPTESESLRELDRFCDAMIAIRNEIARIESGQADRLNNVLKNAPHTSMQIASSKWDHPYSREEAVFPTEATRVSKFWPAVARVNNVLGDRNLICTCPPIEDYT